MLIGGGLLLAAIAVFLGLGQWKLYRQIKDLPRRLGIDIQQQADGVNYTQSRKGKTLFKIHAARAVQMKASGKMLLHDVRIDLFGEDGSRTDTIAGSEFEYDHSAGIAQAAGAVEITIMRPGVKPAISQLVPGAPKTPALPLPASTNEDKQVHVKTSGLIFNQKSGIATTSQRVDFVLEQGSGTSKGATYDSASSQLVLDHEVELHVERDGDPVSILASHAEFSRAQEICRMTDARAVYSAGAVKTAAALIHFREDGSVERLDGSGGVDLQTDAGSHISAPRGNVEFDQQSHPVHALLEGGTTMEQVQPSRHIQGTSPSVRLLFTGEGQLQHAHLEQGVLFHSQQQLITAKGLSSQFTRSWKSQVADIDFVPDLSHPSDGDKPNSHNKTASRVEAKTIHGTGGVVLTSEGGVDQGKSNLSADLLTAELSPDGELTSVDGAGQAHFEQNTAQGAHESSNSDQLKVSFIDKQHMVSKRLVKGKDGDQEASQIAYVVQVGNVTFTRDAPPSGKSAITSNTAPTNVLALGSAQGATPIRGTANRSDYDGATETIHLSGGPRVSNGEIEMAADLIDYVRLTGDAFAHGNVKASWSNSAAAQGKPGASTPARIFPGSGLLGSGSSGSAPIHAIADEAELRESTQDVVFHSADQRPDSHMNLPRIWQDANSVSAPRIVLNRLKQTLNAESNGAAEPVRTVLLSNGNGPRPIRSGASSVISDPSAVKKGTSTIRIRSGDLHYSEGERIALLHAGKVGSVTTETTGSDGIATITSQEAEIKLLPAGVHSSPRTAGLEGSQSGSVSKRTEAGNSIDRVTATGSVTVDWPDRKGTGEKLVFLGDQDTYTLTGTSAAPPQIRDAVLGNVTGSALIFHADDDRITVEGDGGKTVTATHSPKRALAKH